MLDVEALHGVVRLRRGRGVGGGGVGEGEPRSHAEHARGRRELQAIARRTRSGKLLRILFEAGSNAVAPPSPASW